MSFQQKDGSGALFKNFQKKTEKHPDYTGNCMVGGKEYELAAWLRESKKGMKFLSLALKPKGAIRKEAQEQAW